MPKREKVLVPATVGQVGEIVCAMVGEMNLSQDDAQKIIGNMGAFRRDVRRFYAQYRIEKGSSSSRMPTAFVSWRNTYFKLFGQRPDLSGVSIPAVPEGVGPVRLIVVAKELIEWTGNKPLEGTQEALKKHFPGWECYDNLDAAISTNDRDPSNGSYAVWVRDAREADEDLASKSADDLVAEGYTGITLLERQLLEADYFFEKGEHLDQRNRTLCSGSRFRDGFVPHTHWDVWLGIDWTYSLARSLDLRSRRVWV